VRARPRQGEGRLEQAFLSLLLAAGFSRTRRTRWASMSSTSKDTRDTHEHQARGLRANHNPRLPWYICVIISLCIVRHVCCFIGTGHSACLHFYPNTSVYCERHTSHFKRYLTAVDRPATSIYCALVLATTAKRQRKRATASRRLGLSSGLGHYPKRFRSRLLERRVLSPQPIQLLAYSRVGGGVSARTWGRMVDARDEGGHAPSGAAAPWRRSRRRVWASARLARGPRPCDSSTRNIVSTSHPWSLPY
jgi:hypothetical protein